MNWKRLRQKLPISYLKHLTGTTRDEEITRWKQQSKTAEEEARKLNESLRETATQNCSANENTQRACLTLCLMLLNWCCYLTHQNNPTYNYTHQQIYYKHSQDSSTPFQKTDKNSNNHSNINHNTDHNRQEEKAPQTGKVFARKDVPPNGQ